MTAVVAVTAVVSIVPVTTDGTSTGYATLPTSCIFARGQIFCPRGSIASVVSKNTLAGTRTSSTSTGSTTSTSLSTTWLPSSSLSQASISTASASPAATDSAAAAPTSGPNQTAIALGVTFALIALFMLGCLISTRKTRYWPFRQQPPRSEEDGEAKAEVAGSEDSGIGNGTVPVTRASSLGPGLGASTVRPASSIYSEDVSSWTDMTSSSSVQTPESPKDFVEGSATPAESLYNLPLVRPFSAHGFSSIFAPVPPASPPTSPLPAIPLPAALAGQDGHGCNKVCEDDLSKTRVSQQERSAGTVSHTENWFGGGNNGSRWSLQRQLGSEISQVSLRRQPSDGSDVTRSEHDRVTGFEYLMQTGRG